MAFDIDSCYKRYNAMVFRRCYRLLGDEEGARDAMQEVFVQILKKQQHLTDSGLSSLLFMMATRTCLDRLRSMKTISKNQALSLPYRIAHVDDQEGQTIARQMLEQLFQDQKVSSRVIATLHLLDGMTLAEVAEEVGLSVSGVRKRIRAIRAKLQEIEEKN